MNDTHAKMLSGLNEVLSGLLEIECVDSEKVAAMKNRVDDAIKFFGEPAVWHYYMNDEGKPRWKCSNCGRIARRRPDDKRYCSTCSKPMVFES